MGWEFGVEISRTRDLGMDAFWKRIDAAVTSAYQRISSLEALEAVKLSTFHSHSLIQIPKLLNIRVRDTPMTSITNVPRILRQRPLLILQGRRLELLSPLH
jgi:hypothetical protein